MTNREADINRLYELSNDVKQVSMELRVLADNWDKLSSESKHFLVSQAVDELDWIDEEMGAPIRGLEDSFE